MSMREITQAVVEHLREGLPAVPVYVGQAGFYVLGDRCDRCGDVNYEEEDRICITCTYPEHWSSSWRWETP